jgi:hypothetical protein
MTRKITCSECGVTKTEMQLTWEATQFFGVNGRILCGDCKEKTDYLNE